MLKANHGHENDVYQCLKKLNGVKEIYRIVGEYSFFLIMQAKDHFLLDMLIEEIRNNTYVTDFWHILISFDAYETGIASPDRAKT